MAPENFFGSLPTPYILDLSANWSKSYQAPAEFTFPMEVLMYTGDGALSNSFTGPCAVPGRSPLKPG